MDLAYREDAQRGSLGRTICCIFYFSFLKPHILFLLLWHFDNWGSCEFLLVTLAAITDASTSLSTTNGWFHVCRLGTLLETPQHLQSGDLYIILQREQLGIVYPLLRDLINSFLFAKNMTKQIWRSSTKEKEEERHRVKCSRKEFGSVNQVFRLITLGHLDHAPSQCQTRRIASFSSWICCWGGLEWA